MIKPVSVLMYLAFEPFSKLAQMINELSVQVLDAPFNLTFIPRVRWMSKMSFNMVLTTLVFPLISKLWSMIRKNSPRKSPLLFQNCRNLSCCEFMVKLFSTNNEPAIIINAY